MTWVPVPTGSDFPVENLPYGVFETTTRTARVGVAIGDRIVDCAAVLDDPVFARPSMNAFLCQGRARWVQIRDRLTDALTDPRHRDRVEPHLVPMSEATLRLPFEVADYVDFYASVDHAQNLGWIFRPGAEPLTPNWRWHPIGYHGRAGTVVVSGTPITRPRGQHLTSGASAPAVGPSTRLDAEAELGFVVGSPSPLGSPVSVDRVREHVFGCVLVNDWSARDLQAWEYVPLGPFLGKSFATSVSAWVVPLDALEASMVAPAVQDPPPLPYLAAERPWGLNITFELRLNGEVVSRPPFAGTYWSPGQMLAHLTVNGASLRTGDLYASGAVSGPERGQRGSFIELSWNGSHPLELEDGSTRSFLQDGDTVSITARATGRNGTPIGFGEVSGVITPAVPG
jgi:fumarylacetoacetase